MSSGNIIFRHPINTHTYIHAHLAAEEVFVLRNRITRNFPTHPTNAGKPLYQLGGLSRFPLVSSSCIGSGAEVNKQLGGSDEEDGQRFFEFLTLFTTTTYILNIEEKFITSSIIINGCCLD